MSKSKVLNVPYRVCLLGEHVDHQGGNTLSANLDFGVTLEYSAEPEGRVVLESTGFGGHLDLGPEQEVERSGDWTDYLKGVVQQFRRRNGMPVGIRGRIHGSFPVGGLSSSAAVQIAYALAIMEVNGSHLTRDELAKLIVAAERTFVGVQVGMLDPLTILFAQDQSLLHVDHASSARESVDWPAHVSPPRLAVVYSGVERRLQDSPYNERITQCEEAARALDPEARLLCEVPMDLRAPQTLPPTPGRRARHYFEELSRVKSGIASWRDGDQTAFAAALNACGDSCVENFELGTPELVDLVGLLRKAPGVLCARFTGGGFGGAVLVLLGQGEGDPITPVLAGPYQERHPRAAARACVRYASLGPPAGVDSGTLT